jgi:hypothetical protein
VSHVSRNYCGAYFPLLYFACLSEINDTVLISPQAQMMCCCFEQRISHRWPLLQGFECLCALGWPSLDTCGGICELVSSRKKARQALFLQVISTSTVFFAPKPKPKNTTNLREQSSPFESNEIVVRNNTFLSSPTHCLVAGGHCEGQHNLDARAHAPCLSTTVVSALLCNNTFGNLPLRSHIVSLPACIERVDMTPIHELMPPVSALL